MWPCNLPVATPNLQNFLSCPPLISLMGLALLPHLCPLMWAGDKREEGGVPNLNLWRASPDSVPG